MIIAKKQQDKDLNTFHWSYFNLARDGLKHILLSKELKNKKILLPAYIGYSSREGSGVFDPIRETKKEYIFYALDKCLYVNVNDIKDKIKKNSGNVLLLIDYFGFMDKNLQYIKQLAARYKMIIIEDFAHAFFTFYQKPVVDFDYGLFSLHKLFPVGDGGMLLSKRKLANISGGNKHKYDLMNFNIQQIAQKRIYNYEFVLSRLKNKAKAFKITILRGRLLGAVPQSFPILLSNTNLRDHLYFQMNKNGYGVVSLYHELIPEIDKSFIAEHEISGRILNLPVHQDAGIEDLDRMLVLLFKLIKEYRA